MGTRKEDADVKTAPAPEAPARPAPGEPGPGPSGAVPSEPLHGPVEATEDSLDGLQTAFRALPVEEVVSQPVKRKRESEKDAGDEADEGEEQGQDLTNVPTFEGAPSASGLHASPSPMTTTLPIPHPAAATSTPITNLPMAEGTGFTGMPPYPAYGMGPPTTALPEATTASEPVAYSSAPRWYAAEYPHPLPATGTYVDVPGYAPGYATLSGLRRGPESLGGRSRGSGRSSNRSLTRPEINEVLRGATSKIVGDLTQEIREKLEPLMIPPQSVTYHGGNVTPPSPGQPPGGRVDKYPGEPEEQTDADACSYTEKSFRAENGPAALQPRDELDEGRAGPAGADSLEGNGARRALWL